MSQETIGLIQASLERFAATGAPAWDTLHEEVEVHDHDITDAGEYRGHAGFGRWLEDWASAWSEFSIEPQEFLDADERVVAVIRMKAKGQGSGVEVERQDAMVFEVLGGKIKRLDYYNNRAQALEAVGLTE
jgi:ketosteroid isomerase-like protein